MDPRNPKRPEGEQGANWARCRECGRAAHKIKEIRHTKLCRNRERAGDVKTVQAETKGPIL